LLVRPGPARPRDRVVSILALAGATIAAAVLVSALLALFGILDLRGLVADVYLHGSEPKGGLKRILGSLIVYAQQVALQYPSAVVAALVLWAGGAFRP